MRIRIFFRHAMICLAFSAAIAATADAQYLSPGLNPPGWGSYLYSEPYSYYSVPYPNNFYYNYNTPFQPRIGTYLPNQPTPPPPYAFPQPYPFYYQPPLYTPWSYVPPYYPPSLGWPQYYRYRWYYSYPQSYQRPVYRYRPPVRRPQRVAPVGE